MQQPPLQNQTQLARDLHTPQELKALNQVINDIEWKINYQEKHTLIFYSTLLTTLMLMNVTACTKLSQDDLSDGMILADIIAIALLTCAALFVMRVLMLENSHDQRQKNNIKRVIKFAPADVGSMSAIDFSKAVTSLSETSQALKISLKEANDMNHHIRPVLFAANFCLAYYAFGKEGALVSGATSVAVEVADTAIRFKRLYSAT